MNAASEYAQVIARTTAMVDDPTVQDLAGQHGLDVLNVTWEDTARYDDSSVGPNISDMTIQIEHAADDREGVSQNCMPVIRYPNFSDLSGDVSPDDFFLLVGNERGEALRKITLRELLENPRIP